MQFQTNKPTFIAECPHNICVRLRHHQASLVSSISNTSQTLIMIMASNDPHFALFPFMAQGHTIPMLDIARLLARRGAAVTLLLTPNSAARAKPMVDRAVASGLTIRVAQLTFPCAEVGLPEGCENLDMLPDAADALKFFDGTAMLENQVETLLQEIKSDCLISDMLFPWTTDAASRLHIPRIVFNGMCSFATLLWLIVQPSDFHAIASDTEYFLLPNLPDRIEITKAQLRGAPYEFPPWWEKMLQDIRKANGKAFGTVFNTFQELEAEYVKEFGKEMCNRVWCIGPVSLCNEDESDKAERGGTAAAIDKHECMQWLDSQEKDSVIYVCLGSLSQVATLQLILLGLALEASNRPFIWVVRNGKDEFNAWLKTEKFEEKVKQKGLVIHGWAPQVLILSHPSVGGFLTHCGWNSTLEGIVAGVPLVTWPLFGEQFCNQVLVTDVIKTGVRVGAEMPVVYGDHETGEAMVGSEQIKVAIDEVMDGGDEGKARRKRARKLSGTARKAVEDGGSSHANLTRFIEDVKHEEESAFDAKLKHNCCGVTVQ